ncbi:dynamin family protein [Aliarcobacter butzleri]|uniref:dynamin family protein n=1 Tax=Aliarcobacter butzleri TaxID=28197 RepID=UPI0024DE512A|nr:dynamin family protein [Aliarcobacter butzleri]MDK2050916.1 dynamin family protein [Aliarcobacter butzleri]
MHENNILKIQDETIKVISEIQKLLENSKNLKKEHFQTLDNERKKLENLEFVISIVGTVKAGKSTTINAIVGQEILPNRSAPMTTLPTLVTHKEGQIEPSLTMPKYKVLNNFLKKIREELKNDKKTQNATFLKNSHGEEIAKELSKKDFEFRNSYKNREEIFEFLKTLNDLMRLAKDLELKPPYGEFEEIDELPRIEVEFYYLKNMKNVHNAKLSLLDTPGPDEFGHSEELKNIFTTQLKQSSAIMLVMNYTVINNEGAGKAREEIQEIQKLIEKDNLFVLANKFDEKTSKDPDYKQTKQNISKSMFNETIKEENIFPLSSKWAYLVNLAKREIELNGKIDKNISWAEDFGNDILGKKWESKIEDNKEVEECCIEAWQDSYFEEPLNKIIIHGYSNTTFKSLSSVLHKIKGINEELLNVFKVSENSLKKDIDTLNEDISNLEKDIKNISNIQKSLNEDIKKELENIEKNIEKQEEEFLQKAKDEIGKIYDNKEEEHQKNQIEIVKAQKEKKDKEYSNIFQTIIVNIARKGKDKKTDKEKLKEDGLLRFENENDAKSFILELNEKLKINVEDTLKNLDEMLKNQVSIFIPNLNKTIEDNIGSIIEKIKEKVGDDIQIKIPNLQVDQNGNILGNHLEEAVETKTEKLRKLKEQEGLWGAIKRFFDWGDNEWGNDEYYVDNQYFELTKEGIDKKIDLVFKNVSTFIKETIDDIFEYQIKHEINLSVNKLIKEIENYRYEMMDVVKKKLADAFDKKREIASAKEYQKISIRLSERIEKSYSFLREIK